MLSLLNLAEFLLATPLLLCLLYTLYLLYVHQIYSHIPGPPVESFFLGNLPTIRGTYKKGVYSHILFLDWARKYGPVYKIFVLHKCMVFLSNPSVIKEVLTRSRYRKASMTYSRLYSVCGERFLGHGLVTMMNHKLWKRRRAIINPAFHKNCDYVDCGCWNFGHFASTGMPQSTHLEMRASVRLLSKMMDQFNEMADKWLNQLEPLADGGNYFDMAEYFGRVTLDVIGKVAFGANFHALDDVESPFRKALWHILEGYSAQLRDPLLQLRFSKRQFVQKVQRAVDIVRSEGQRIFTNHDKEKEDHHDNILHHIIKYTDILPNLSEADLLDEFCMMLIAGQETTSNMLGFLFKELGNNDGVLERMLEEMNQVLGERDNVTFDDINRLEYLGQVIKETLRLYPPAMGTARESVDRTVLHGYHIPSGTQLVVSFYIVHHMPEYFPDPDTFRPERFDPDATRKLYTFMPFSLGQRSCVGRHFAMIEAKVLLCKFFKKFTFELEPNQLEGIQETTTLRPKGGVRMRLSQTS
ncbi:hypothetical protein LSH36_154g05037 [Paralvinella palmiformis]|uniref:Cytochrome P450 n=1 Tax=Paralvinella palmiformis TaxID=53620 RepID=A0AAD9JW27_9ANNE|nr:hypothetical protein LSH36_154g05037 [Paralvinella palmiformis]